MVVEGDVGGRHAPAQPRQRADDQHTRLVALELQPGLGLLAPLHRGRLHGGGQGFGGPLVGLLVALPPGVADHAVGLVLQAQHGLGLGQKGPQRLLHGGRGHLNAGLVAPQVVQEELAQALAVDMAAGRAAFVELVRHAPGAFGGPVGPAVVRVVQVVLAQVLAHARQQHDTGAVLRVLGIQRLGCALGQVQALLQGLGREGLVLAAAPCMGRAQRGGQQQTQAGGTGCRGRRKRRFHGGHHRRSLCSRALPISLGMKASPLPAAEMMTPVPITLQVSTVPTA